jgi:flagellar hook assembly protein FlgD
VPEDGKVKGELYTLSGTMVNQFAKGYRPAGEYMFRWFGTDKLKQKLNNGIYLLRLTMESDSGRKYHREIKVILVK